MNDMGINGSLISTHCDYKKDSNKNEGAERPHLLISLLQFVLFANKGLFPAPLIWIPFSYCGLGLSQKGRYKCLDPDHSIVH